MQWGLGVDGSCGWSVWGWCAGERAEGLGADLGVPVWVGCLTVGAFSLWMADLDAARGKAFFGAS